MDNKKDWYTKTNDMLHDENNIKGFTGDYRWLSNFYPCAVFYEGRVYGSSEAAYQSAKTVQTQLRDRFTTLTASESKKLGRQITIRDDWNEIKLKVMHDILLDKFTRDSALRETLLATGDKYLEETNWWNDTFWGVCKGVGENNLGKTLMKIRQQLKENK